jgi:hypothetical protein
VLVLPLELAQGRRGDDGESSSITRPDADVVAAVATGFGEGPKITLSPSKRPSSRYANLS